MDIKYIISVDEKGATKAIQNFDGTLKGLKDTTEKQVKPSLAGLWKQFAIGQLAADALKKGIGFLKNSFVDSVKAAMESEQAQKGLEAALATTGRTVDGMLPDLIAFAGELQKQTTVTDEAAMSTMALLTQLTNLNKDGLKKATEGAIGLTTVGLDLETATRLIAKATMGQTEALTRYGIIINKNLPLEKQREQLFSRLAPMFARAKAETDTFGGALKQLGNMWDEVKEAVGRAITENDAIKNIIQKVKEVIVNLIESGKIKEWVDSATAAFETFANMVTNLIIPVFEVTFPAALKILDDKIKSLVVKLFSIQYALIMLQSPFKDTSEQVYNLQRSFAEFIGALDYHDVKLNETGRKYTETGTHIEEVAKKIETKLAPSLRMIADLSRDTAAELAWSFKWAFDEFFRYADEDTLRAAQAMVDNFQWGGGEIEKVAEKTTRETSNYFDGLYNDIAQGWGNTIQKWMSGATTFKDFMKSLWDDVKNAFFRVIGEMAAKFAIDLIKQLITGVTTAATATTTALASIGTAIGGIGAGLAGLITALATAIAAAATTLAAAAPAIAIVAALGLAIYAGFSLIKGLMDKWFGASGEGSNITYWLKLMLEVETKILNWTIGGLTVQLENYVKGPMVEKFDALKASLDLTRDQMIPRLDKIVEYTALLKRIQFGQHGLDTMVNRPTMFMAGERGPERVTISPNVNFSSTPIHVHVSLDGKQVAIATARYAPELSRDGVLKFHQRGLITAG